MEQTPPLEAHPRFFEVKCAELQFILQQQQVVTQLTEKYRALLDAELKEQLAVLLQQRNAVFAAAGLDTTKNYNLDDATRTITEVKANNKF